MLEMTMGSLVKVVAKRFLEEKREGGRERKSVILCAFLALLALSHLSLSESLENIGNMKPLLTGIPSR